MWELQSLYMRQQPGSPRPAVLLVRIMPAVPDEDGESKHGAHEHQGIRHDEDEVADQPAVGNKGNGCGGLADEQQSRNTFAGLLLPLSVHLARQRHD